MRSVRAVATIACVLALGASAAAQVAAARAERPRMDTLTASINGRVTTDRGAPIRRAEVRATSDRGLTRLTTTDEEGRFQIRDLPEGVFTLHASKSGFVPLYYGQRRPTEKRSTVRVAEGQRASASFALPRAGAITGRIFDQYGEPIMGSRVQALRSRVIQGQRGLQATGAADVTDDTGAYRLYGLDPGDYYVTVAPPRVEDAMGRVIGAVPGQGAPIFYPGTANRAEAERIVVEVGTDARADMQLVPVRTSRVSGVVLTSSGAPATGAMVRLVSRDLGMGPGDPMNELAMLMQLGDDAGADGTFELAGVPPGSFMLQAQFMPRFTPTLDPNGRLILPAQAQLESTTMPINVDGDVNGLTLATSPGGTLEVELAAAEGVTAPLPRGVRVRTRSNIGGEMRMVQSPDAKMVMGLGGGSGRVTVEELPDNWAVKAIVVGGEDVTDQDIQVRNGQTATARVLLTDRVTEVNGTVAPASFNADNNAVRATVVIFADDAEKWTYPSRFIRSVQTAATGGFTVTGLPPDENYRVVALDYVEDGEETDPAFLERLRSRAARLSLREGERKTIDVRMLQR